MLRPHQKLLIHSFLYHSFYTILLPLHYYDPCPFSRAEHRGLKGWEDLLPIAGLRPVSLCRSHRCSGNEGTGESNLYEYYSVTFGKLL